MQRSGSASAFNTIYIYKPGMQITFDGATNQFYYGLSNISNANQGLKFFSQSDWFFTPLMGVSINEFFEVVKLLK